MGRKKKKDDAAGASKNGRRAMDWEKKPYAVIVGGSPVTKGCFTTLDEAVKYVTKNVPVKDQPRSFIGKFSALEVETTVKVKQ